jgi:putative aldouronate transport system substrate-binding protein
MTDGTMGLDAAFDTAIPALVGDGFMTSVTVSMFRKGDEVMSGWTTDGYREYLEWVLNLMDEGVLYKDFLSLDSDRGVTNTAQGSGQVAVWQANADKMEEILGYTDDPNFAVAAVPRIAADPTATYEWNDEVALVSSRSGFSMSSTCENPELVCQWQNYFWTTEGYLMANYGVEGESYHMDGDTPVFDWDSPVTVTGKNAPNAEMAQNLFTMMRFVGYYQDNDMLLPTFSDTALDAVELWTLDDSTDDRNYPSAITFTAEENDEIDQYQGDLLTYTAETCLKFLDGALELNDDTWNEFVSTCDEMGLGEITAVYQNAYDEYVAGER